MSATFAAITAGPVDQAQFLDTGYDMQVSNQNAGIIMRAMGYGDELEINGRVPCGTKPLGDFRTRLAMARDGWQHRPDMLTYLDQLAMLCQSAAELDETALITWA